MESFFRTSPPDDPLKSWSYLLADAVLMRAWSDLFPKNIQSCKDKINTKINDQLEAAKFILHPIEFQSFCLWCNERQMDPELVQQGAIRKLISTGVLNMEDIDLSDDKDENLRSIYRAILEHCAAEKQRFKELYENRTDERKEIPPELTEVPNGTELYAV